MDFEFKGTTIRLAQGDITEQEVDAVVNAANSSLVGGGGVDGAIRRAGGEAVDAACEEIRESRGRLPCGQAVATTAGGMPAAQIIHTVGPRWKGGDEEEPKLLSDAYRNSLQLAVDKELATVAFPSISTGAYGYPVGQAARRALEAVREFLDNEQRSAGLREVRFVLFSERDLETYSEAAREVFEDVL